MFLNSTFINSPLEQFEVTNLIGINAPILGYLNITLSNLGLCSFAQNDIFFIVFILLAGKAIMEGLDIAAKTAGLGASVVYLYDRFSSGGNSSSENDKDDKKKIIKIKLMIPRIVVIMKIILKTLKKIKPIVKIIIMKISQKVQNRYILLNNNNKNKFQYGFYLPFILSNLGVDVSSIDVSDFSYAILIISVIALYSFINIIGYMLSYIFIQNRDYENKYPKLKKFVGYYKKSSLIFITIEVIIVLICLLILIISSLAFIYLGIKL